MRIKKFKNLKTYALDISSTSGLKILDKSLSNKKIHCLINLAFTDNTRGHFQNLNIEKMKDHINQHFLNYINPTKILINRLSNKSSIIFYSSIWSEVSPKLENHDLLNNLPSIPQAYSKSGLNGFMRQLAIELANKNIRVNCISWLFS